MTDLELQRLAAEIGEKILSHIRQPGAPGLIPAEPASGRSGQFDPAIASLIDHTILRPDATDEDVTRVCREALQFGFATVFVNPCHVPLAAHLLAGSKVRTGTVAGFPLGANATEIKVKEAEAAIRAGAREIDMVINVGALRSGNLDTVRLDMQAVAEVGHAHGAIVKAILENAFLNDEQKEIACRLAMIAKADFVKTSTGFGPSGATVRDVELMRRVVGPKMGVKAAGGIRTLEDLRAMIAAGATRIGSSASVKIVEATAA